MKKKQHITAFYLETLLMIVVFISIILVLTRVFGTARAQSTDARHLTAAVTLAQSTAEAVSASKSPQELQGILGGQQNVLLQEGAGAGQAVLTAAYDEDLRPVAVPQETLSQETLSQETLSQETLSQESLPQAAGEPAGADRKELKVQGADLIVQTLWGSQPGEGADDRTAGPQASEGTGADGQTGMKEAQITVFEAGTGKTIYTLKTSVYLPQGE